MKIVVTTTQSERRGARNPERSQARAGRRRMPWRAGLLLLAVLASGYIVVTLLSANDTGGGKIVNIRAAMDGFDMKEIHIQAAEKITVNLSSLDNEHHPDGGGKHQFAIDELGVNIVAQPSSFASATFSAARPGAYTFYCGICCGGKENPAMIGTLVVDPADGMPAAQK